MSNLIDMLAHLDIVDPIEGFVSTFRFADWRGAFQREGTIGVIREFFSSLAAQNCWTIGVQRDSDWSGEDVEQLLFRHGVRIWGRGFNDQEIFFRVKRRQIKWAEYLLLRAGVPVTSILVEPRNAEWTEDYEPGSEPPTRQTSSGFDLEKFLRSLFR